MKFAGCVEWELTGACNLSCAHCYAKPGLRKKDELDTAEALGLARSLAEAGCRSLTLSGGEPTLRADWPRIAEELAKGGTAVQLVSNGQNLDREQARKAASAGLRMVLLSLDGMEASHDHVRRRPGAFQNVLRAADALGAADVPVGFITTVLRRNAGDLEPMARLMSRLGAALWQVWLGIPQDRSRLWMKPGDTASLVARLHDLRKTCPVLIIGDTIGYGPGCENLRFPRISADSPAWLPGPVETLPGFRCESGRGVLAIESNGEVKGCLALPRQCKVGSVREQSLETLQQLSHEMREKKLEELARSCAGCRHVALCQGGCHAMALAPGGRGYCLEKTPSSLPMYTGRKAAAAVAASVLLATSFAAGCSNSRKKPATNVKQEEVVKPKAGMDAATESDAAELPAQAGDAGQAEDMAKEDFLAALKDKWAMYCVCESDEKDENGKPLSTEPCMCISHMMCPPSQMWLCPDGTTMKKTKPEPAPEPEKKPEQN